MKILYISNSIIPSRTANSIHVMKMCQAFAENGHQVVLIAPNNKSKYEKNVKDIFDFYGVKKNFKIQKLWYPDLKIGTFFYSLSVLYYLLLNRMFDLVYGRFLHGCYFAALFGNKIIFESHAPIYEEHRYTQKVFEFLIKNKNFEKLVVISQALKNMYIENTILNDKKIQVVHDGADEVKSFSQKIKLFGKEGNLKVGYVGHLYKGKGIEIIQSISNKVSGDIEFHIIGDGTVKTKVRKDTGKYLLKNVQSMAEREQMSLFTNAVDPVLEELSNKLQAIDPNALTPMQALLLIDEWKKLLDQ